MSDDELHITRRTLVAAGALASLPATASAHEWQLLTEHQAELVTALADAIVPPDDNTPGAGEAGAADYFDKQLRGPLKRFEPIYHLGLPALDATAQRLTAKGFLYLSATERTAFLERVEAGEAEGPEWSEFTAQSFFRRAIQHVMQSYYGSPKHGGNRDAVSWKMLGVEDSMH